MSGYKGETLVVMGKIPGTDAHITFAFKHNCSAEERRELVADFNEIIPLLPLECEIGSNTIKVGKKNELDAYPVEFVLKEAYSVFAELWNTHQRRPKGDEMFPFNMHVTLNSDEKRKQMVHLLATCNTFQLDSLFIRELETKEVVAFFPAHPCTLLTDE